MALKYVQALTQYLAGSGALVGATNVVLVSLTDIYGNAITTMTPFGAKGYCTLEPDTVNEEAITFTSVTANANGTVTLGGVSTVLAQSPYTETSGTVRSHSGGTKLVITDNVAFWSTFANKNNAETIVGLFTFPDADATRARITTDTDTAVATCFVTLGQLSRQAISGASNASSTTKGIVQEATQAQVLAKTAAGSTGAELYVNPSMLPSTLLSDYKADTGAVNAYAIAPAPAITAYVAGQTFSFITANANTAASTLNVSGLGTKNIYFKGAVLTGGEIATTQIVVVEYDGTQFNIINPVSSVNPSGAISMYAGATAPAGWLLCDGASYLNATYASLFAVLGTTYGSADGSHFNVPDMRGRVAIGVGTGTGGGATGTGLPTGGTALTALARAQWKGEETHTLTTQEIASHTHPTTFATTSPGGGGGNPGLVGAVNVSSAVSTSDATGGGGAHNNMQPVMGLNFIIKT